jgi:glycosyltransferase involved in cell wall biosynthesis
MSPAPSPDRAHVAHVLSSFQLGGQERVALDLARQQVRAGLRVAVVSLTPPPDGPLAEEFSAAGVAVDRVARPRPGLDPRLVLRLRRWFRDHGVDLVHTHNRMALIYGAPSGRLAGCAVVHTKHGYNPRGGKRLAAGNLAGRFVDVFVAVSEETAAFARRRREVPLDRLVTIPNGIPLDRFRPDAEARRCLRSELGIAEDAWVVGTVGRLAVEKNQALLLRAVAPLLGPAARLLVVGDGPLRPELADLAARLDVSRYVHFPGVRRDVAAVLNALDAFVLSSEIEGLPLVVPEAMATALPVVATAVGGIPGVIGEGETGFLIPSGDEQALRDRLERLHADRPRGVEMGRRGRDAALARFSSERMHREYLAIYQRALARRRR